MDCSLPRHSLENIYEILRKFNCALATLRVYYFSSKVCLNSYVGEVLGQAFPLRLYFYLNYGITNSRIKCDSKFLSAR